MNMITQKKPNNEKERLAVLKIIDAASEEIFDDFIYIATNICDVSQAVIVFIDQDRLRFKSKLRGKLNEIHRKDSFCDPTILQDNLLEITSMLANPRYSKKTNWQITRYA
jgi:hypothetical protein